MELYKKLREVLEKKKKVEEPSEDLIICSRCGREVKKDKATFSIYEGAWVCDECFFRFAE